MAQRTVVQYIDDIDGSEAVTTVQFTLDGKTYEIDLNKKHDAALRKTLEPYISAGRVTGRTAMKSVKGGKKATAKRSPDLNRKVREWARKNGWADLGDRGRVPSEVYDAYYKAHPLAA